MRLPVPGVGLEVQRASKIQAPTAQGFVGAGNVAAQMLQDSDRLAARSEQMFQLELRQRDAYNDATAREQINAYRTEARKVNAAFRQLRGLQADDKAFESAVQSLREQRDAVMARLGNEAQKAMFAANADLIDATTLAGLDEHRADQTFRADYSASKARSENAIQDAAEEIVSGRWKSPDGAVTNYQIQKRVAIREAESLAEKQGLGDEEKRVLRQGALNAIHTQGIRGLIRNGNAREASEYFKRYADEIAPEVRDDLQGLVRQAEQSDMNLASAVAIEGMLLKAAPAPDMIGPPLPSELAEARDAVAQGGDTTPSFLAKAQQVLDEQFANRQITAQEHDDRLRILESRMRLRMNETAERERALRVEAESWLVENPLMPLSANAELFERVKRAGLVDTLRPFEENSRYVTDPRVYQEWIDKPASEYRNKSAKVLFEMLRGKLSNRSLDHIMALHADYNKVATPEQRSAVTWERRMEEAGKQLGYLPRNRTPSPAERDAYEAWAIGFDDRTRAAQEASGKKFTEAEMIVQLQAEVAQKMTVQKSGWFGHYYQEQPIATMTKEEREAAGVMVGLTLVPFSVVPKEFLNSLRSKMDPRVFDLMPPRDKFDLWVRGGMPGATEEQARMIRGATATPAPAKPPMVWPAVPENARLPDIKK